MLDTTDIMEIINQVTSTYEKRRMEEIISSQTKTGRISPNDVPATIGKVLATKELRSELFTAFGLTP